MGSLCKLPIFLDKKKIKKEAKRMLKGSSGMSSPRRSSVPAGSSSGTAFFSAVTVDLQGVKSDGSSCSDIVEEPQVIEPAEPSCSDIAALVVDDDEMPRRIIPRHLLKGDFAAVFVVKNGAAAIACYKEHPNIGFVTMDFNMPGMNGIETISALKKIATAANRELRIVGLTSEIDDAIIKGMVDAGAERVFGKPSEYRAFGTFVCEGVRHNSIP